VDNNPLKYIDPTGHGVDTIIFDNFLDRINRDKTSELNIWIGEIFIASSEPVLYPCIISSIHEYASVVGYGAGCSFPKIETVAFSITRVPI
jgi:hypothetical protein